MPRSKNNNINILKPDPSDILVCQNSKLKPYIESFFHEPENLTQKNTGFLFGVLEITDYSEDSSYIVNFLISTLKKEFYKNTKRGSIESLESALHKANLALSKLAQHENINWINNIHAVVGIFEKNNLHISSAGKGTALIIRNGNLINLTGEKEETENSNPLKTFEDIISGKIENEDKLIITTPEIFDIFSFQELKKSTQRFSREKFIRFLKTALSNELDQVALLTIDFSLEEKAKKRKSEKTGAKKINNVFSQKAFENKKNLPQNENGQNSSEIKENPKNSQDKGHLYIKEDLQDINQERENKLNLGIQKTKENLSQIKEQFSVRVFWKKTSQKISALETKKKSLNFANWLQAKIKTGLHLFRNLLSKIWLKIIKSKNRKTSLEETSSIPVHKRTFSLKTRLLVYFQKIISFYKLSSPRKKTVIITAIFLILFFFFLFLRGNNEKNSPSQNTTTTTENEDLEKSSETNNTDSQTKIDYLANNSPQDENKFLALSGENLFVLGKNYIFDIQNQEKIDFPQEFGTIKEVRLMEDLNLIFLLTQNGKIISLSPLSKKFQEDNINLPIQNELLIAGTYMTYLYFIDKTDNQIYRYPRAEGGFGEKTNWLAESIDLSQTSTAAINENIFVINSNKIIKLFKGKQQEFSLPENINPNLIFTQEDDPNIYLLDKTNKKAFIISNEGTLVREFENEVFSQAKDIKVETENKIFYLLLENGTIAKFSF